MNQTRIKGITILLACLAVGLIAGPTNEKGSTVKDVIKSRGWEARFQELLPAMGHRNWIVVADAAFPLQISPGMEVIASGEELLPVLDKVLAALDKSSMSVPMSISTRNSPT